MLAAGFGAPPNDPDNRSLNASPDDAADLDAPDDGLDVAAPPEDNEGVNGREFEEEMFIEDPGREVLGPRLPFLVVGVDDWDKSENTSCLGLGCE